MKLPSTPIAASTVLVLLTIALYPQTSALAGMDSPISRMASEVGIDQRLDAQVPLDLVFRDETGRTVALREYFGTRPVILTLVYYQCPMLCTQVLNGVLKSSQAMKFTIGEEYDILTVSIDPAETPELAAVKKERYARSYRREGAQRGWHFLTGEPQAIERLTHAVGFRYRFDPSSKQFAHASGIMLLTPAGKVSRYFYGIDYPPGDLRLGLVESSAGRVGSPVDQILLLCYHYDPNTGRYGLAIANVMRAAGMLTVLALGSFLCVMFRRERRLERSLRALGTGALPEH